MGIVKLLPEKVINQIAAGEVVERPASIVKELVDNALDSGTENISVRLTGAGANSIIVTDTGSGMSKEDALMAFERHATSKLTSLEDLYKISTNGFRGEALSSISSVSSVVLTTKRVLDEIGTRVSIRGGKILSVDTVSCSTGTTIEVQSLFFNVPARKKFLKSDKVEESKIKELFCAYALGFSEIDFELYFDEKNIFNFRSSKSKIERAKRIIKGSSVSIQYKFDDILVSGLIGHPGSASSDGANLTILVNSRFVSDKFILRAVKEGFSSTLKEKEFPIGVIEVSLPGDQVDVNVHPQKSEVRFTAPQKVFAAVKTAIDEGVRSFRTPQIYTSNYRVAESESIRYQIKDSISTYEEANIVNEQITFSSYTSETSMLANSYRFVGQIFECFLLFEKNQELLVVDMHAAHERVNYNKIYKTLKSKTPISQSLLIPEVLQLSSSESIEYENICEHLINIGFNIENNTDLKQITINEIPSLLQVIDWKTLLRETLSKETYGEYPFSLEEAFCYICARRACHASFRRGDILSSDGAYLLLDQILSTEFGSACPHGRPCMVSFKEAQIEKWFGRDK